MNLNGMLKLLQIMLRVEQITLERETIMSKTCKSNIEELNVVACGLEHGGVHDNMSQIQEQNHQCDGGGCQQGSELTLEKGLGANLVVHAWCCRRKHNMYFGGKSYGPCGEINEYWKARNKEA